MKQLITWIFRLVPAIIMGQTLFFKFTGSAESRELFTTLLEKTLGHGSWEAFARVGMGMMELLAIVLLLTPKWSLRGAFLTIFLMAGALLSHALFLGFDGSYRELSVMACVTLMISFIQVARSIQWQDDAVRV